MYETQAIDPLYYSPGAITPPQTVQTSTANPALRTQTPEAGPVETYSGMGTPVATRSEVNTSLMNSASNVTGGSSDQYPQNPSGPIYGPEDPGNQKCTPTAGRGVGIGRVSWSPDGTVSGSMWLAPTPLVVGAGLNPKNGDYNVRVGVGAHADVPVVGGAGAHVGLQESGNVGREGTRIDPYTSFTLGPTGATCTGSGPAPQTPPPPPRPTPLPQTPAQPEASGPAFRNAPPPEIKPVPVPGPVPVTSPSSAQPTPAPTQRPQSQVER